MSKIKSFFQSILPSKRKLIQLYAALLYNANLMGFVTGNIFTGKSKTICLPGMNCYSCPGAIGACPLGSLQNALSSKNYKTITYVVGILLLYAIIFGRLICGWFCPGGFFQELLYKIKTPKLKKNKVTRVLSYLKYVLLALLVVYLPIIFAITAGKTIPGFCKYICPIGMFEGAIGLISNKNNSNYFSMLGPIFTWKFFLLVLFIVGSIFIYRIFCRFFCPLGALYGLFNKLSILGIKVNDEKCNHCGACVNHCKMDVKYVGDHECIMCGECIDVCHAKAINWKLIKEEVHASLNEDDNSKLNENSNEVLENNESLQLDKPKKKLNKKFIVNGITTLICVITLLIAILYSNINWSKAKVVSLGDKYTSLNVTLYDSSKTFDLDTNDKVTLLYYFDNYNAEEIKQLNDKFKGKDLNLVAISSYSNRELNKNSIDSSLDFIFAYDADSKKSLKSFGGNDYPFFVWLNKNDELMYFSNDSFISDEESIDAAIAGKIIGNKIGNLCYSMDISLIDADGNTSKFSVKTSNGKIRIINFWYTSCGPCVGEMPHFNTIANDPLYKDKVEVIAIHDTQTYYKNDYLSYLNVQFEGFNIKFGVDNGKSDYYRLLGGKEVFPMTVIIDEEGIITYNNMGSVTLDLLKSELDKIINK